MMVQSMPTLEAVNTKDISTCTCTNVDHWIRNQQISLNSLGKIPSPGVDENHSRGGSVHVLELLPL